jgi:acetate kinase
VADAIPLLNAGSSSLKFETFFLARRSTARSLASRGEI